ncbi:MAG TPA: hypothetical protein VH061_13195 [Solirubrobacteraceae bacterium]|nr:hypothetical protein [Solirubrobacteraceae bacterium]
MRSIRNASRRAPRLATAFVVAALTLGVTAGVAGAQVDVMIVSHNEPPASYPRYVHYFTTIQSAVDAATRARDFVLIEPGTYEEEVKVTPKNKGIFIRGMDRNTVLLDGKNLHPSGGANGIEVLQTNEVWIENLTVANFEKESVNGGGGNEIFWNGRNDDEEKVAAHGWFGNYLTAYVTGLNGGYGIFTKDEKKGEWDNIYASGFNDSGMYLGGCPECEAVIDHATMEYNSLGYSGSNSGGKVIIENSTFEHNSTGIAPNTENPGDGPPPQNGACKEAEPGVKRRGPLHGTTPHHGPWKGKLPTFKSTNINHCTIFENNKVNNNDNLNVSANHSTSAAPWGIGIELPGVYGDLVLDNEIKGNPNDGVLAFEYPNPFEPNENFEFPAGTVLAQNSGNRVEGNTFENNGYATGKPAQFLGDVAFEGGIFGARQSTNNCAIANTMPDHTFPVNIEGTWGCQHETTPNPGGGFGFLEYLLQLQEESVNRPGNETVPPPPAQETMPDPCEGVPANPLCP